MRSESYFALEHRRGDDHRLIGIPPHL